MVRRRPSLRWKREHNKKIAHRWKWEAVMHAWSLNNLADDGKPKRAPYPCWWGDDYHDGETAEMHWHVGRPSEHHESGYEGRWPGYSAEERSRLLSGEERRLGRKSNP
jgi:hypothetical protein